MDACLVTFLPLFTRMTIVASSPLYLHSLVPSEHILLLNGGEILPLASLIKPLCESPSSLRITPNSFPRFTRPDLAHLNHTNLIRDFSFYCLTLATLLSISSTHLLLKAETSFLPSSFSRLFLCHHPSLMTPPEVGPPLYLSTLLVHFIVLFIYNL